MIWVTLSWFCMHHVTGHSSTTSWRQTASSTTCVVQLLLVLNQMSSFDQQDGCRAAIFLVIVLVRLRFDGLAGRSVCRVVGRSPSRSASRTVGLTDGRPGSDDPSSGGRTFVRLLGWMVGKSRGQTISRPGALTVEREEEESTLQFPTIVAHCFSLR